ncbi:MAG: hypothetical protein IEMM0008_0646 [bacterium]|nr:MAG: hypothetical protein IEMM0008_0646 [bacterium]
MIKEKVQVIQETQPIVLDFQGIADFQDNDKLFEFCIQNRETRIERTWEGKIILMLPVGGEGGVRESTLTYYVFHWNKKSKLGKVLSPSGGFILPSGAMRSPDVSFIKMDRWKAIPLLKRKKFLPMCPDFVGELRSESDSLNKLKDKMEEWMDNGCRLAWLIDPLEEKAYIYRPNRVIEELSSFDEKLSGEDVLPNFELDLNELREE